MYSWLLKSYLVFYAQRDPERERLLQVTEPSHDAVIDSVRVFRFCKRFI